jgi:glycine/D-amino acid oxidase-like deaminating enzyme
LWLYTTSNAASGIKFDLNGGTATATTLVGDSMEEDGTTFGTRTAYSSLSTGLCGITAVSTATCHITGTIVVNAAGTFAPRFAQNVSGATASVVKTGSVMTIRPLN